MAEQEKGARFHKPTIEDFVYEGEETPLLFRKKVVFGIVIAFVALIGGYIGLSYALGFSTEIDAEPFRDWVEDLGWLGPFAFILVMAFSVLFAPIPNVPIFIAAGLVWGPVVGTAYSMAGMMLGSVMAFYAARWAGRKHIGKLIGKKMAERLDSIADTMGGKVVFWARMLPAVNFDWISFVAGVTSIGFSPFIVATFFGMLLPTTVGVVAGDGLGNDFRITLAAGSFWLLGIVLSALYFWLRRRRYMAKKREAGNAASGQPAPAPAER